MCRQGVSVILLAGVAFVAVPSGQRLTIPEAVRRMAPGPYVTSRIRELSPLPFGDMVHRSDMIVQGTLKNPRVYLSADQTALYTDYDLLPIRVIADRGTNSGSRVPGPPRPIVVRQWGGETTIEGVKVKIYDENLAPLPIDTQLLLFLVYDRDAGEYDLFDGIVGAFSLSGSDNRLRHLLTPSMGPSYHHLHGTPLADVIQEIHSMNR